MFFTLPFFDEAAEEEALIVRLREVGVGQASSLFDWLEKAKTATVARAMVLRWLEEIRD